MMTTFDKREQGFESKFAHDEELRFKATARRNKLLGLWVAEKLGKTGPDAENYAREVMKADFEEVGDEDVYRKVSGDLGGKATETEIRTVMNQMMAKAVQQVQDGA
ncbi:hypothetical protein GCM10007036_44800 [Alsobacter metallidurans]|uniref:DUF1476 domain-containing protein n=2 Tax=Alsobacter metallidurans TaxID=340221 RepID=A0A917IAE4_9HYPH|nr:hypothetical protein GCM10007036_44800 [Alsobacter metallidurans]